MSILIKGMDMPNEGAERCIVIRGDGKIRTFTGAPIDYATAIPVPPHGRLIDAEQPIKEIEDAIENIDRDFSLLDFNSRYCMERGLRMAKIFLKTAPTIIKAEGEE